MISLIVKNNFFDKISLTASDVSVKLVLPASSPHKKAPPQERKVPVLVSITVKAYSS
jgi:hypothetical protein